MKKRSERPPHTPEIPTDPFVTIEWRCLVCGEPTGIKTDSRKSLEPDIADRRDGLCPRCEEFRKKGCVLVFTDTRDGNDRGKILDGDAWKRTQKEELHHWCGKVVRLDKQAMDSLEGLMKGAHGSNDSDDGDPAGGVGAG